MSARNAAAAFEGVEEFLDDVEAAESEARERALREIQPLVRYAKRFYREFLNEAFEIKVKGFTFRDKRKVARRMVKREHADEEQSGSRAAVETELAEFFEEIVDALQGDIDFGYSDDVAHFVEFHSLLYPEWLESVASWLEALDADQAAEAISDLATRYRDVAEV